MIRAALVALALGGCGGIDPDAGSPLVLPSGQVSVDAVARLLPGPAPEAAAGWALAVGDFDGDGRDDLAVGAPGMDRVALYLDLDGPPRWLQGPPGSRYGAALAAGDVDGDGRDEVLVGAPDHGDRSVGKTASGLARGAVFVEGLSGRLARVEGADPGDCAGAAVAVGDVDGDGRDDLLVGTPCRGSVRSRDPSLDRSILIQGAGAAWLLLAPLAPEARVDEAALWLPGPEPFDQQGAAVLLEDLDGDGTPDPVVGAPDYFGAQWINPSGRGAARAWSGRLRGSQGAAQAFLTVRGGCCGADLFDESGVALAAGDLDGDGQPELLVGAPGARDFGILGAAWLLRGPASGDVDGLAASVLAAPPEGQGPTGGDVGRALAAGFDLDGDGVRELAVGGPGDGRAAAGGGVVQILEGLPGAYTELLSGGWVITASSTNQRLGQAFAWGDLDGDGRDELVIGAPGDRSAGHGAGGAFVLDLGGP